MPDAAFVGGVALRVWTDKKGIRIPASYGNDFDITRPDQTLYEVNKSTPAGWVDIFPAKYPIQEPFFTKFEYKGDKICLAIRQVGFVENVKYAGFIQKAWQDHEKGRCLLSIIAINGYERWPGKICRGH